MIKGCRVACAILSLIAAEGLAASAYAATSLFQETLAALSGGAQTVAPPASVEVAFSPEGGATDLVVKAVRSAKRSVHVAAYSLTSKPVARALIEARQNGRDVRVVIDHDQVSQRRHSVAPYLTGAGIPVHVDVVHDLQHNKYMIIDGQTVENGSFNYTSAAEHHNAENVLVLWQAPALAAAYERNWQDLWDKAEAYGGQ